METQKALSFISLSWSEAASSELQNWVFWLVAKSAHNALSALFEPKELASIKL